MGYSGDGGTATAAKLNQPLAVAADAVGNVYIADTENFRIRRVSPDGIITTVAGTGVDGYSGDGGPGTAAQIGPVFSLAVDSSGNLYIPDPVSNRVRRLTPQGIISTFAGGGPDDQWVPPPADGTPAYGAAIMLPRVVAMDSTDNLYVVASGWPVVLRISVDGKLCQVPGTRSFVSGTLAINSARGVCYPTFAALECLDAAGHPTTIAGTYTAGYSGDGGPATAAEIYGAGGMAFDPQGNLYFSDGNHIRRITPQGIINTVERSSSGVPAPSSVRSVAADGDGNTYIADSDAYEVLKLTPGGVLSVVAGNGTSGFSGDGGPATSAQLSVFRGIAVDSDRNLYIADWGNNRIRKVSANGIISTLIGGLYYPMGVAVGAGGTVYVADTYNNRILQVTPDGHSSVIAGTGPSGFNMVRSSGDGGPATLAGIDNPQSVAVDAAGNVYVAETPSHRIRRFQPGGNISTFAGNGAYVYSGDGSAAASASLFDPYAVAVDSGGNVYVADSLNQAIRRIDSHGVISTFAGTGVAGYAGDGGPAIDAQLNNPQGVAVDSSGAVYIADALNNAVRRVTGGSLCNVASSPAVRALDAGAAAGSFNVTVSPGTCDYTAASDSPWLHVVSGGQGTGGGVIRYEIDANSSPAARSGRLTASAAGTRTSLWIYQSGAGCQFTLSPAAATVNSWIGDNYLLVVDNPPQCMAWEATSDSDWLTITLGAAGAAPPSVQYSYLNNPGTQSRTATLTVAGHTATVTQPPSTVTITAPAPGSVLTSTFATFTWHVSDPFDPYQFTYRLGLTPNGSEIAAGATNSSSIAIAGLPCNGQTLYFQLRFTIWSLWEPTPVAASYTACSVPPVPARFVPVTPCRVMDTRSWSGKTGSFGFPALADGTSRDVPVPLSGCGIPDSARAYSLNITVVPPGPLTYLTIWPAGQPQPLVSTLNSFDGRVVANAAIVPAGINGAVSVFVSNTADVIIDINGYFAPADAAGSLSFYPVTPCRVVDTRGNGLTGPFGTPSLSGGSSRDFPVSLGSCGVPASAQAYSLNFTVVPRGPLGYLTSWPAGAAQPVVSTLNSLDGSIVANAAIVPAGEQGAISVFVTDDTELIIDVNGYFAPPGSDGALSLYTMNPCRVVDTRPGQTPPSGFGPPAISAGGWREFPVPYSSCGIPARAKAYSMNVTVVPHGPLTYLTTWPTGQTQPLVSTLNSPLGKVLANAAIIPAGSNGWVSVFATDVTDLILDINGYFDQ